MSSSKKIILVIGATGKQGSSVAHTFLKLSNWHVRCLTRDTTSASSKALTDLGAEVVQGDLSSPSSLAKAFKDANAIFLNTCEFWTQVVKSITAGEPPDTEFARAAEIAFGRNASVAAAAVPSLERLVFSTLPEATKFSKGRYTRAGHFDAKAAIVENIKNEQPELFKKTSLIYVGAYASNTFFEPRLDEASGKYQLVFPTTADMILPLIDEKVSTGPFVRALVEDEDAESKLLAYDSMTSLGEMMESWSKVYGKETELVTVTPEFLHETLGLPMAGVDGIGFASTFGFVGGDVGVIEPKDLKKKIVGVPFEEWLKAYKEHKETQD